MFDSNCPIAGMYNGFCLFLVLVFLASCTPYQSYTLYRQQNRAIELANYGACDSAIGETTRLLETAHNLKMIKEPGKELIWRYRDKDADLDLAIALHDSAYVYSKCGRLSEAASLYARAAVMHEKVNGPHSYGIANALNDLGTIYIKLEQFDKAVPPLERALEIYSRPENRVLEHSAKPSMNLERVYYAQGKMLEAEAMIVLSLKVAEELYRSGTIDFTQLDVHLQQYVLLLQEMGRKEEATELIARRRVLRNDLTRGL